MTRGPARVIPTQRTHSKPIAGSTPDNISDPSFLEDSTHHTVSDSFAIYKDGIDVGSRTQESPAYIFPFCGAL